jgi:hypothetical protein
MINIIKNNENFKCNSVAGSGKTTNIIKIINEFQNCLILTYNKNLRKDTIDKIDNEEYSNNVHTFHSFCNKYYFETINDLSICKIIDQDSPSYLGYNFDIIIIDEAQDLTDLYYNLILKILKDNKNLSSPLCLFGDKRQCIYNFKGADENIFISKTFNKENWKQITCSQSFRITKSLSDFINSLTYPNYEIKSNKLDGIITYIISDNIVFSVIEEIIRYIKEGFNEDDIFILMPSIKTSGFNSNAFKIQSLLTLCDFNIGILSRDNENNKNLTQNKILISSFHGTKGLERKIVIILNFDSSYFEWFNKSDCTDTCPNIIYTALTRSSLHVSLIKIASKNDFSFINTLNNISIIKHTFLYSEKILQNFYKKIIKRIDNKILITKILNNIFITKVDNYILNKKKIYERGKNLYKKSYSVCDSIDEFSTIILKEILDIMSNNNNIYGFSNFFKKITFEQTFEKFSYNYILKQANDIYENISNSLGNSVLIYLEFYYNNKIPSIYNNKIVINKLKFYFQKDRDLIDDNDINKTIHNFSFKKKEFQEIFFILGEYLLVLRNKFNYRFNKQLTNYNFINDENFLLNMAIKFNLILPKRYNLIFEKNIMFNNLSGCVDIIDVYNNNVYEIKTTNNINENDYLQLILYSYILNNIDKNKKYNYYLVNLNNFEIFQFDNKYFTDNLNQYFLTKCFL